MSPALPTVFRPGFSTAMPADGILVVIGNFPGVLARWIRPRLDVRLAGRL